MAIDLFLESVLFDGNIRRVAEGLDGGLNVGGEGAFRKSLDDTPDPVGNFLQKTSFAALTNSPGVSDERWDAPLMPATFTEHSNRRFEKASSLIRRVFAKDQEAAEEAIAIARQMLADARAEVLATAAG